MNRKINENGISFHYISDFGDLRTKRMGPMNLGFAVYQMVKAEEHQRILDQLKKVEQTKRFLELNYENIDIQYILNSLIRIERHLNGKLNELYTYAQPNF